jgi:hypothetical protein
MDQGLLFFLFIIVYFVGAYLLVIFVKKNIPRTRVKSRIASLSFLYAFFYGLGIAASGGDPGFGMPAPNGVAIAMMLWVKNYNGVFIGLEILAAWWIFIAVIMVVRHMIASGETAH